MSLGKYKLYRQVAWLRDLIVNNSKDAIRVNFYKSRNFGDALNPILLNFLGVRKVWNVSTEFYKKPNLQVIGSILQVCNEETIVWGAGFISKNIGFYYSPPKKVLAVRGPRTREKLLSLGVQCPEVYGDPALLLPLFFQPNTNKKYKVGIVPHYSNFNDESINRLKLNNYTVIDVMNPNTLDVVKKVLECEIILSSSLHGIIIGDAYRVPSYWIKFSKQVGVDDFKFFDYFESVGRLNEKYIQANEINEELISNLYNYNFKYDPIPLLKSFPYQLNMEIFEKASKYYNLLK